MVKESGECEPAVLDSEDLLFMLYTSGSTGNPKGIVHSQAGYLLYASLTHSLVFDCKEGDIFGCVADIEWITGHSYVVYAARWPTESRLCVSISLFIFIIHFIDLKY
jgi:acetyl-CoA synthetase